MSRFEKWMIGVLVVISVLAVTLLIWRPWSGDRPPAGGSRPNGDQTAEVTRQNRRRPGGPDAVDPFTTPEAKPAPKVGKAGGDAGGSSEAASPLPKQPHIRGATNPQVASVIEAGRSGKHPERRTALIQPQPFDRAAWAKDPQAYLDICEPGRVFQPAQPGKDVPQLSAKTPQYVEIASGAGTELAVQAIPGSPVTFTSFDLGNFANDLTSITVRADDTGLAKATFKAIGTVNDCNILAASPMCSGQVTFMVFVPPPAPVQPPVDTIPPSNAVKNLQAKPSTPKSPKD